MSAEFTPDHPRSRRSDGTEMVRVFRDLALVAGEKIMEIYRSADLGARQKADSSPVTLADEAADAIISSGLRKAFPDLPLITEEQSASHALQAKTFLIVDPLDGTKEFVQRRGDFTVNIALVENGVPVLGVVYAPAKQRLFYTLADGRSVEETGPFQPGTAGSTTDLRVKSPDNTALRVVASKSHRDQATDDYIARYAIADVCSAGSSLKFCLVAAGEADFYPRLGRTMEWDTAAGDAVLRGAGGRMVHLADHSVFTYGKPGWENGFFIATTPEVVLI